MDEVTGQQLNTELKMDCDVHAVLEFMQQHVAAAKLVSVAEMLPQLAKLLWGDHPQELCRAAMLTAPKPKMDSESPSQLAATL